MNIKDKNYSLKTLKLLMGQKELDVKNIPESILIIAEAVDNPYELPYLIETMNSMEIDDKAKFRFVLLRVQIDSNLRMNEDLEMYQKRLYVAQVIEKLLYGELFFESGKEEEEDEGESPTS